VPGVAEQVALVAWLRWRTFRNSLQTPRRRMDTVANLALAALAGLLTLVIGAALGTAAYALAAGSRMGLLAILLWAMFIGWQMLPLVLGMFSQDFDFRNLLRFPLRFPAFYALSLAYGVFDPVALVMLLWFACLGIGIVAARPEVTLTAGTALALLAATSLLLNRVILLWLDKWMAKKRTRETLLAVFLFAMVGLQLAVPLAIESGKEKPTFLKVLRPAAEQLPPGLACSALARGIGDAVARPGKWGWGSRSASTYLALLALYPAGLGLLLARRLRRQYEGEVSGEESAAAPRPKGTQVLGWHLPGISGAATAMFEKELRYFLRSGMMLMNVLLPVLFVVFFAVVWSRPGQRNAPGFVTGAPEFIYPAAVGYAVLVLAQMAYNAFAYDASGIQMLFAVPVKFREVLLGKNLAYVALTALAAVLILAALAFFGFAPSLLSLAVTLAGLAFVILAHFSVGNVTSLYFPKAYDFERLKQRARGMTIIIYLAAQVVVMGISASVIAVGRAAGGLEIALVIFLVLDAVFLRLYLTILDRCTAIAEEQQEGLVTELCK
jgi:ABC-2 type transport system permease protein